jgi:hypothetical protein
LRIEVVMKEDQKVESMKDRFLDQDPREETNNQKNQLQTLILPSHIYNKLNTQYRMGILSSLNQYDNN